jgi:endonuclease/exonuclease/phosphatase family metal-dependent hydrolase
VAFVHVPPALRAFSTRHTEVESRRAPFWPWPATIAAVLATGLFAWPPTQAQKENGPARIGTYNIHYGYDTSWHQSLEEQARTIEESGADIVLLQEVDACRVTSYGIDNALWLARRLGMQEVFAPTLEGLSGIALLTRFPITISGSQLLSSRLEQTAMVYATMEVGYHPLDAYGVWLGLEAEERERQLNEALDHVSGTMSAVLGGDLNATPDSPTYARLQTARFEDPFVVAGLEPAPTYPAIAPAKRIDYVWVRDLEVLNAEVLDSVASDHRMVVVEVSNELQRP